MFQSSDKFVEGGAIFLAGTVQGRQGGRQQRKERSNREKEDEKGKGGWRKGYEHVNTHRIRIRN